MRDRDWAPARCPPIEGARTQMSGTRQNAGSESRGVESPRRRRSEAERRRIVAETREVHLAGGRLSPSESLAVARHSAHGFGWGDGGSGSAQLALAATTCHRAGKRRRSLPDVQVGGHRASAAGGLYLGALHGPRLACLAVRAVRILRPDRLDSPARATMHKTRPAARAACGRQVRPAHFAVDAVEHAAGCCRRSPPGR